jgi:hypothetical protein
MEKNKHFTAKEIIEKRKTLWLKDKNLIRDKEFVEAAAIHIMENEKLRQEIQNHPEYLIEMVFYIVDKNKKTMPFFLNTVQKDFIAKINDAVFDREIGKIHSIKFLVLKGRQQGFTSVITAYQTVCVITRKNYSGFTAADEDGNTATIFQAKAKYPYNLLPDCLKPTEKYNNRRQLLFKKLNSDWEIKTATKNMGRSRTINFFHGSEAAFWKCDISDIQASIGDALTPDAIQILESTANGFNEYKDLWDSDTWINCFYEWWKTPEYRHSFESAERKKQFIKDIETKKDIENKEQWIYKRCSWLSEFLDIEQVYWYFNKHKSYIDKDKIKQEYPCTEEEAFLSSGSCIFNTENLLQRKKQLQEQYEEKPYTEGEFLITWNDPETMDKPIDYKWVKRRDGIIRIYEDVKPGYPYVIGGDTKGDGSDFFAGTVINNTTGRRVATLHNDMKSKAYTAQMWALAKHYNMALVGIEINWNTYPVELLEDWHYPKQWQRERYDTFTGEMKKAYGWRTDGNTRPLIIEKEITEIEENIHLFTDIEFISECLTFVKDEKGRPDALSGKHDDILISDMIANECRGQQSYVVEAADIEKYWEEEDKEEMEYALSKGSTSGGFYDF